MKKLLLLLLIAPVLGFGQGEQRYADGSASDQDRNTFEWINYGDLDWAIENAEVVTYRDGTPILQVSNASEWSNLTTGAWCYHSNDPTKGKLYNWYAVAGIYDEASLSNETLRKEFAPDGWVVPSSSNWSNLRLYLIDNGYNFDGTTTGNKIAKSMASTSMWDISDVYGSIGNDKSLNNMSGFNSFPNGFRDNSGYSGYEGSSEVFWSISTIASSSWYYKLDFNANDLKWNYNQKKFGFSVRFVRDASTASIEKYSNAITIYPNPTTSIVTLQGGKQYNIEVYDLLGNKVMETQGNSINMAHLSTATYIVKATDKSNNEELTYKVVKN